MLTKRQLIKLWVQYLKSNNIAKTTSRPSGDLVYNRRPTKSDLIQFLTNNTYLSDDQIREVIAAALRKEAEDKRLRQPVDLTPDIWNRPAGITEDEIRDSGNRGLSDTVILYAFEMAIAAEAAQEAPDTDDLDTQFDRIKDIIDNSMLPEQRQALWRLLNA